MNSKVVGLVLAAVAIVVAIVLVTRGGGDREIPAGELAESVPESAQGYGEIVLDPSEELADTGADALESLGEDPAQASAEIRAGLASGFTEALGSSEEIGAASLDEWVGSRAGGFVLGDIGDAPLEDDEIDSDAIATAVIVAVDDPEQAREALEEMLGPSESSEEGALYTGEGDTKVVLLEDRLLLGTAEAVDASLAIPTGSSLANQNWFQEALESVGGPESLGFLVGEGTALTELSLRSEGENFAERFGPRLIRGIEQIDFTQPYSVEVSVGEAGGAIDLGYGLDERAHLGAAQRDLAALPADSWMAVSDPLLMPVYLQSFKAGMKIGLEGDRDALVELIGQLGYDPIASLDALTGESAMFAAGEPPALRAGAFLPVDRKRSRFAYPVDAARFALASFLTNDFEPKRLRFGGPFAFTTELPTPYGVDVDVAATEVDGRLGVTLGYPPDELPEAFAPKDSLGDGERLAESRELLGDEWKLLGFADLDQAVKLATFVDPAATAGLDAETAEFLETTDLLLGARADSGRIVQRYLLAPR